MIATDTLFSSFIRLVAPLVWARDEKIAEKLLDFAATETGSALDMFAAAELTEDPKLRRLYFRHALDEARHAEMFRKAAKSVSPNAKERKFSFVHATRQNLFANLGEVAFLAFVYLAEKRGEAHFRALAKHFEDREEIRSMLQVIAKDERFHVAYSKRALMKNDARTVRMAIWKTRLTGAWLAWRRQGRIIGDLIARALMTSVFVLVVPFFALALRVLEPERRGWKKPGRAVDPRRQF